MSIFSVSNGVSQLVSAGCKRVHDTAVGRLIAGRYHAVKWEAISNEFACRAKRGYDENLSLDSLGSYTYDEKAVVAILDSVLSANLRDTSSQAVDVLASLWRGGQQENRTFVLTSDRRLFGEHLCTVGCSSARAAGIASVLFSDAMSHLGIVGVSHPSDKNLYLSTKTFGDYLQLKAIIDKTGLDRLRDCISAKRVQLFTRETHQIKYAVHMPDFENGKELVQQVPDTFTMNANNDSKVLVAGDLTVADRTSVGYFVSIENAIAASVDNTSECLDRARGLGHRDYYEAPTVASRNTIIFSKLLYNGFMARPTWAGAILENEEEYMYVDEC